MKRLIGRTLSPGRQSAIVRITSATTTRLAAALRRNRAALFLFPLAPAFP
jgi:hypothetical protein